MQGRTTALLCLLVFLCGFGVGKITERTYSKTTETDIGEVYNLLEHQSNSLTVIIGTQQLQLHYLVPHTKDNGNPFCPLCRKLGWSSNADLE